MRRFSLKVKCGVKDQRQVDKRVLMRHFSILVRQSHSLSKVWLGESTTRVFWCVTVSLKVKCGLEDQLLESYGGSKSLSK